MDSSMVSSRNAFRNSSKHYTRNEFFKKSFPDPYNFYRIREDDHFSTSLRLHKVPPEVRKRIATDNYPMTKRNSFLSIIQRHIPGFLHRFSKDCFYIVSYIIRYWTVTSHFGAWAGLSGAGFDLKSSKWSARIMVKILLPAHCKESCRNSSNYLSVLLWFSVCITPFMH